MKRRGRVPPLYLQVAKFLRPCKGYEKGKTINEIALEVFESDDAHHKQKARLHIHAARRNIGVPVFSIKPPNEERRYCHLISETEYSRVINDFERHILGTEETKKDLKKGREAVKEKERLDRIRKEAKARRQKKK